MRHLARHLYGSGDRNRPPFAGGAVEQFLQIMAVDEFLRDEGLAFDLAYRVGLYDVAVDQAARDIGFMAKTQQKRRVAPPLLHDALDHTEGFEIRRAGHGQEDLAHAAPAERAQQNIRPEARRKFVHQGES